MSRQDRFLLGYGERLVSSLPPPKRKVEKAAPYTFVKAVERIKPMAERTANVLRAVPLKACPRDQAVALVTVHPEYTAKSYLPHAIFSEFQLSPVGSRAREITPEKTTRKGEPKQEQSIELFVSGSRRNFDRFVQGIRADSRNRYVQEDLIKLEEIRPLTPEIRTQAMPSSVKKLSLEVVLHVPDDAAYVVEGFQYYLGDLGLEVEMDRAKFVGGLCFVPMLAERDDVEEIATYSFVRVLRSMPHLRPLTVPVLRATPAGRDSCTLPAEEAISPALRVAVFDGGLPSGQGLDRWVQSIPGTGVGREVPGLLEHGLAVTSALLFGPLSDGQRAPRPICTVDHYRVIDDQTARRDPYQLFDVLSRIERILATTSYQYINFSIGPRLPVEDDEVHVWTAVLDELLNKGEVFATVAVGNDGDLDWDSGIARIQPPSDCVNAVAIGACDSRGRDWDRAVYSSVGHGRRPGFIRPEILYFGGSDDEPFNVLRPGAGTKITGTMGTSFAAPYLLRTAVGVQASLGSVIKPLTIRALIANASEQHVDHRPREHGWGRGLEDLGEILTCDDGEARIIFQEKLLPGKYIKAPVPLPSGPLSGFTELIVTLCYATPTDPSDPVNYTRAGLDVVFRLASGEPMSFFQSRQFMSENELRRDAHKWETLLHKSRRFRASTLQQGAWFEIHHNARSNGYPAAGDAREIPYALVIKVVNRNTPDLYDRIATRYRTQLTALRPVVQIPVRIR